MTSMTRAIIASGPHDLKLGEVGVTEPGPGQVLIRIQSGGICGSDLHYYQHGGFGTVRIKEPLVLGHEIAGTVVSAGAGVTHVAAGDRVAVNPSLPCGKCERCLAGHRHHCTDMRFFGSAMRTPHVQGGFRDLLVCAAEQAVPLPANLSFAEAALAEPTAVCLHALARAGDLVGKRVLITGAGPIGMLLVAVARMAGAAFIAVTDRIAMPLGMATRTGADLALDVGADPQAIASWVAANRQFDVHFEASGSAAATLDGLAALAPLGICVLVGQGAEVPLQISSVIRTEADIRGSFRFDREYQMAVDYLGSGRLKVGHIVTSTLPAARAIEAFDLALDKNQSVKVQLDFS
jgi:L-idonate 5-dehydrogenase